MKIVASDAEDVKKISKEILYGYMMNSLSCVLQKGIANAINGRVCTLNGRLTRTATRGYGTSRDFVSTHEQFSVAGRR